MNINYHCCFSSFEKKLVFDFDVLNDSGPISQIHITWKSTKGTDFQIQCWKIHLFSLSLSRSGPVKKIFEPAMQINNFNNFVKHCLSSSINYTHVFFFVCFNIILLLFLLFFFFKFYDLRLPDKVDFDDVSTV